MGRRIIAGALVALCATTAPAAAETTAEKLQATIERVASEHLLVPGIAAYVEGPRAGLPWKGATGTSMFGSGQALHPDDTLRIASTTKIFTSASILRLAEQGRLSLDDTIAQWLPAEIVDRIHVLDGVSYGPRITIRQMLGHTSGIFSHDEDPLFAPLVAGQPTKRWTAEEEIEISMRNKPYFKPGEGWYYSDTAYVMLGLIISRATGKDLGAAVRDLLGLDRLGLRSTWWELFEGVPAGSRPRAHQYFKAADLYYHSPSWDSWGGGGIVSTVEEVTIFMRALFEGRVFERPETLRTMLGDRRPVPDRGFEYAFEYAYGIGNWRVAGVDCWGHPGWYSSVVHYCPALDVAFALTTNQAEDEHGHHPQTYVSHALVEVVKTLAATERAAAARLRLTVRPKRGRAGRRTAFRFLVQAAGAPIAGASIRVGRRRAVTDHRGRGLLRLRLRRGRHTASACKPGLGCARVKLEIR